MQKFRVAQSLIVYRGPDQELRHMIVDCNLKYDKDFDDIRTEVAKIHLDAVQEKAGFKDSDIVYFICREVDPTIIKAHIKQIAGCN